MSYIPTAWSGNPAEWVRKAATAINGLILTAPSAPGSSAWGAITGVLSDQTDLSLSLDGKQPKDADLTALAALGGTNTIYYRSGASAWSAVAIGSNLSFSGGTLNGTAGTVTSVGMTVPTGFAVSGSPVTTSGTLAVTYAAGYQGYTSTEATKLAGIATGATANTGTVTSVAFSGGTTGLTVSGSPITTSGTITLSGTLAVANGGTGVTTSTGTGAGAHATQPQFTNTIGVGAAASASGSGVSFPATQSASTDPNTLDDYEEGTWTPTVASLAGTITTVGTVYGSYTKIGRKVDASAYVEITTNGTGATGVTVSLPFAAAASPGWAGGGREMLVTGTGLAVIVRPSTSQMEVYTYNNTYPGGSGYGLLISVTYFV